MLIGHIAVSLLEHRFLRTELAPTLIGGLFPDIVDKTMCQVLHITPSGRMWAHTLLGLAVSTSLVRVVRGPKTARAWALGYTGHLVADADDGLPLWYPFRSYEFRPSPGFREILQRFFSRRERLLPELALLLVALLAARTAPRPPGTV